MKSFLLGLLCSATLLAAPAVTPGQGLELNKRSVVDTKYASGTQLVNAAQFGTKGTWDFAVSGGAAATDIPLLDKAGRRVSLPTGAVITNCLIDVVTQPASSTGSASIAISSKAVADLKAATFPASYTTTLPIVCIPVGTVGTMIKTTSELQLKIRVGSEALTAGKINVWVQYVLSE